MIFNEFSEFIEFSDKLFCKMGALSFEHTTSCIRDWGASIDMKTQVTERIFKLTLIHASAVFPEFTEFTEFTKFLFPLGKTQLYLLLMVAINTPLRAER